MVENPIVTKININGIENKSIYSEIEKITKKTEKYPFIQSNFVEQKNQLLNIVRNLGFYFAYVETVVEENQNNSINLIYNFKLGERAKINKIEFVGNKVFKNNKLRKNKKNNLIVKLKICFIFFKIFFHSIYHLKYVINIFWIFVVIFCESFVFN